MTSLTRSFYVLLSFPFWSNNWSNKRLDGKPKETSSFYSYGHYIQFIFHHTTWTEKTPLKLKVSPSSYIYFLALVQIQNLYFRKESPGKTKWVLSRSFKTCFLKQKREAWFLETKLSGLNPSSSSLFWHKPLTGFINNTLTHLNLISLAGKQL